MKQSTFRISAALTVLIFGLLGIFTSSCNNTTPAANVYRIDRTNYSVQIVDGCEYLVSENSAAIAHKGDCKNPIHNYNNSAPVDTTIVNVNVNLK